MLRVPAVVKDNVERGGVGDQNDHSDVDRTEAEVEDSEDNYLTYFVQRRRRCEGRSIDQGARVAVRQRTAYSSCPDR